MNTDLIWNELLRVLRATLGQPQLTVTRATEAIDVPGWDSLSHTIILIELEKALEIRLPLERLPELGSVGELADLLEEMVNERRTGASDPAWSR